VRLESNPLLMERMGVRAVGGAGALKLGGRYLLLTVVEGGGGKYFLAVAESHCPTDGFRFWDKPVALPGIESFECDYAGSRLTRHQDGWIYGVFPCCTVRTRDLNTWEVLPGAVAGEMPQQPRPGVPLFPRFMNGRYAFSAAPGAAPMRSSRGWIHLTEKTDGGGSIRALATDLDDPLRIISEPGGVLLAPEGGERIGNTSNRLSVCGVIDDADGNVYIYYVSSDTRLHVASTTADRLTDAVFSRPAALFDFISRNLSELGIS
jgi:4-O-beta-D-mannosyl-D-glucose phosphorylase